MHLPQFTSMHYLVFNNNQNPTKKKKNKQIISETKTNQKILTSDLASDPLSISPHRAQNNGNAVIPSQADM